MERETERERETHTHTHTHTDRQTDKQTEIETERQRDRETESVFVCVEENISGTKKKSEGTCRSTCDRIHTHTDKIYSHLLNEKESTP